MPTEEALCCLARHGPIVEIGAGTGYWARCLRERGVDVLAYDEMGEEWRTWFRPTLLEGADELTVRPDPERPEPVLWTEVLQGGPEVLGQHAGRTLLLCWPGPWNAFDEAAVREYPGDQVVLVGDPASLSDRLGRLLAGCWKPVDSAPVAHWPEAEDRLVVYWRRRPPV